MNSNNIHKKSTGLTREDIELYRSTKDEAVKHTIEKYALESDFESDALEGWSDPSIQLSQMNRLDKRFTSSNNWIYWVTGSMSVLLIIGIVYFANQKSTEESPKFTAITPIETVEKTDLEMPTAIEKMVELPKKDQIAVKTIVKDFSEQQKNEIINPTVQPEVDELPTRQIDEPAPEVTIAKETLLGKEIYLKNLKLLDYRAYRSRPKISTQQMVLTGTPANVGETKNTEEEFVWKEVDIPYIDYLEKTMEFFSKGQNKKALTRFVVILETYPDDVNANFYAGLCYFNLKEYSNAIQSFEKCSDSKFINFKEESDWYLAKSLLANGKKSDAISLFEKIANSSGYYAAQAKKIVSSL